MMDFIINKHLGKYKEISELVYELRVTKEDKTVYLCVYKHYGIVGEKLYNGCIQPESDRSKLIDTTGDFYHEKHEVVDHLLTQLPRFLADGF